MAQKTFLEHMTHWGEAFLLLLQVLLNPFEKGARKRSIAQTVGSTAVC